MVLTVIDGVLTEAILEEKDTHIDIPEGCSEIDSNVFSGNTNILCVTLPSSVRKIGEHAFSYCKNLREINLETVEEIGIAAFCDTGLRSVILGPVKRVPTMAFMDCTALESVVFPDTLREIGALAFSSCSSLTQLDLKQTERIESEAFEYCTNIQSVHMPCVTDLDTWAFSDAPLIEDYIADWFRRQEMLQRGIVLPFQEDGSFTDYVDPVYRDIITVHHVSLNPETASSDFSWDGEILHLPRTVMGHPIRTIAMNGVYTDFPYRILYLPPDTKYIFGWNPYPVFRPEMEEIHIPAGVSEVGSNPFFNCPNLRNVVIDPENPFLEVYESGLYHKVRKSLLAVLPSFHGETFSVREGTVRIEGFAIASLPGLKHVLLPDSIQHIHDNPVYNCPNLQTKILPKRP